MQNIFPQQMIGSQGSMLLQKQARIFVGEIPLSMSQADIFEVFARMGICQVNVFKNGLRPYQSAIISYDA